MYSSITTLHNTNSSHRYIRQSTTTVSLFNLNIRLQDFMSSFIYHQIIFYCLSSQLILLSYWLSCVILNSSHGEIKLDIKWPIINIYVWDTNKMFQQHNTILTLNDPNANYIPNCKSLKSWYTKIIPLNVAPKHSFSLILNSKCCKTVGGFPQRFH